MMITIIIHIKTDLASRLVRNQGIFASGSFFLLCVANFQNFSFQINEKNMLTATYFQDQLPLTHPEAIKLFNNTRNHHFLHYPPIMIKSTTSIPTTITSCLIGATILRNMYVRTPDRAQKLCNFFLCHMKSSSVSFYFDEKIKYSSEFVSI